MYKREKRFTWKWKPCIQFDGKHQWTGSHGSTWWMRQTGPFRLRLILIGITGPSVCPKIATRWFPGSCVLWSCIPCPMPCRSPLAYCSPSGVIIPYWAPTCRVDCGWMRCLIISFRPISLIISAPMIGRSCSPIIFPPSGSWAERPPIPDWI